MRSQVKMIAIVSAVLLIALGFMTSRQSDTARAQQVAATPTPATAAPPFDQAVAIAKLKEQIKGREAEPADKVFKNLQTPFIKALPAARLLAVMEFGYSRSLGVNCTHCHVPEKWESDEKTQKPIAREMAAMMTRINGELLKGIKNLKSETPTINCTTCHRGEIKPALNLPAR